jgi:hypothetical protein
LLISIFASSYAKKRSQRSKDVLGWKSASRSLFSLGRDKVTQRQRTVA